MGYPRPGWRGPDRLGQLTKVGNDRKVEPQKGKRSSKSLKKREHKVKGFRQFKKGNDISREHARDQRTGGHNTAQKRNNHTHKKRK